jgi:hypothetical protein
MRNEFQRYFDNLDNFNELLSHSEILVNSLVGVTPNSVYDLYGERIFVKLLCHGITLKKISPSSELNQGSELWDISSSYAVARALIETFGALSYIALANVDDEEKDFRLLFWKLHAEARRLDMLTKIGSKDPSVESTRKEVENLKAKTLAHRSITVCSQQVKSNVENGKYQPYHLTQRQRNVEAGVNHDYHDAVTMHLSSHVHTHPFSVQQILEFKAGSNECVGLMGIAIQYSSAYLAKAIEGMRLVFSESVPVLEEKTENTLVQWLAVATNGIRHY